MFRNIFISISQEYSEHDAFNERNGWNWNISHAVRHKECWTVGKTWCAYNAWYMLLMHMYNVVWQTDSASRKVHMTETLQTDCSNLVHLVWCLQPTMLFDSEILRNITYPNKSQIHVHIFKFTCLLDWRWRTNVDGNYCDTLYAPSCPVSTHTMPKVVPITFKNTC